MANREDIKLFFEGVKKMERKSGEERSNATAQAIQGKPCRIRDRN